MSVPRGSHGWLLPIWLLFVLGPAASAQAQPEPTSTGQGQSVTIACFVPQLAFPGAMERSSWFSAIGRQLSQTTGLSVDAKGFARINDFKAFIANQPRTLALVDAQLAATSGWPLLLQAVGEDGLPGQTMALVGSNARTIPELKGKSLILASLGGMEKALVAGLVLQGEVSPAKFFKNLTTAPDAASAASAVALGKADAALVLTALARTRGLPIIFETERIPLPVLVDVSRDLEPGERDRLVSGMGAAPSGGGVAGWKGAERALLNRFQESLAKSQVRQLVPSTLPWLPFRDDGGQAGELTVEPLPAGVLFVPLPPALNIDFMPQGQLPEQESQSASSEAEAAGPGESGSEGSSGEEGAPR